MELNSSALAMLNPSTQPEPMDESPRKLLQPSTSVLTPTGMNLLHKLEDTTPQGTHTATAEYKEAAATPDGEDEEARKTRLATERQRLVHRARDSVQKKMAKQVAAEDEVLARRAAIEAAKEAGRAAFNMRLARRQDKRTLWAQMAPSCREAAGRFGFMPGMWDHLDTVRGTDLAGPLVRQWWWPWNELPKPLKLAARQLGYDR